MKTDKNPIPSKGRLREEAKCKAAANYAVQHPYLSSDYVRRMFSVGHTRFLKHLRRAVKDL